MKREYFEDYERAAMMNYEMRDGAALMLSYVAGIDVSHARRICGCPEAWARLDEIETERG